MLGPGGRHVQPALAAVAQQRAPLVAHPAVGVLAVPDRQDDRVPLVALHPLQVLDEERLRAVLGEEALQVRVVSQRRARSAASIRSACLMPSAITPSDSRRAGPRVLEDQLDDLVHLGGRPRPPGRAPGPGPRPRAAGSRRGTRRGTWSARRRRSGCWRTPPAARRGCGSARPAARSAAAGAARPAPTRSPRRTRPGSRSSSSGSSLSSPTWRKKLVGGSCRSSPATTIWCPRMIDGDRVGGDDLAGLVEDHHVEQPGRGQHLAHHQRRHGPARLDREQHVAGLVEQPPQRQVAAAQRRLLADDPGLQRVLVQGVAQPVGPGAAHPRPVGGQVLHVAHPEVAGDLVERVAVVGARNAGRVPGSGPGSPSTRRGRRRPRPGPVRPAGGPARPAAGPGPARRTRRRAGTAGAASTPCPGRPPARPAAARGSPGSWTRLRSAASCRSQSAQQGRQLRPGRTAAAAGPRRCAAPATGPAGAAASRQRGGQFLARTVRSPGRSASRAARACLRSARRSRRPSPPPSPVAAASRAGSLEVHLRRRTCAAVWAIPANSRIWARRLA